MVQLDADQVFLIALLIVLAIVVFFELRFMRSRNKDYVDRAVDKDATFNALATTKAIATTLKGKGRDTRQAELVIVQAEQAYRKNNFVSSRELAMKAREILISAPMIEMVVPEAQKEEEPLTQSEKDRRTVQDFKKMEPNLIESRFIIGSCRDRIEAEETSGKDLTDAKEHLAKAEAFFEEKKYSDALREGMKIKRAMGDVPEVREPVKDASLEIVPKAEKKCNKCSAVISSDDAFCRKCGTPIESRRSCDHCQADLSSEDVFCPKCGRRA